LGAGAGALAVAVTDPEAAAPFAGAGGEAAWLEMLRCAPADDPAPLEAAPEDDPDEPEDPEDEADDAADV
jgi:hypothetical protein